MPKVVMNKELDTHIGERIRQRRVILDMSQSDLGALIGVSFQQVQKYENGTNRIAASKLFTLSKLLSVDISYFYDGLSKHDGEVCVDKSLKIKAEMISDNRETAESLELQSLANAYSNIEDPVVRKTILKMINSMETTE